MKATGVRELKKELSFKNREELVQLCLRLSKFKKENKELLTYLLFESHDEENYIENIKAEIDAGFEAINKSRLYFMKKGIRKVLRNTKKFIRYSGKKETQVELLLYFCKKMNGFSPSIHKSKTLQNLYERQLGMIQKSIDKMHPDLQYDYNKELEELFQQ